MEIALCGLTRSGKTTLWQILTGNEIPQGARVETRRGIARVPDARLDQLAALFKPKKFTPATVTYVDLAPMERTSNRADNPVLNALRPADALVMVLRAWDDEADPHPDGSIDIARDLDLMETEFLLADIEVAQRRLERLDAMIPKTNKPEDKKERELMARCLAHLESEKALRDLDLTVEEKRTLRGYAFLSGKPLLVAVNLAEGDAARVNATPTDLGLPALEGRRGLECVALSARIEEEIARLSADEAEIFRADLGIAEPALDRLIRASYHLLGLMSFFTVGEDECRAWTIPHGTPARAAAGAIHSDLEKGFIRAEVIPWDKMVEAKTMAVAKEKAWLRLEGKEYVVQDGDVVHVRHSG